MQHQQYAPVREHDTRTAQCANPDAAALAAAHALD